MSSVIEGMLKAYTPQSKTEYEGAIQEIMQEISLLGLWRAKFFEHAAFYGGTSLRILHGLGRFSEDLDFSLLKPDPDFRLLPFVKAIEEELEISGLKVSVDHKIKHSEGSIRSAFLKTGTLETFIRIGLDQQLQRHTQSNEVIKIKLEIDVDPPPGFETEVRYLTRPFPFSVRTYVPEDLFAGKVHALLCRPYKVRVKGRDWYDLIWYVSKGFRLHLSHLESRMRQSGHYKDAAPLTPQIFLKLIEEKIAGLDVKAAREDIRRFISIPREIEGWSQSFFLSLLPRIQYK
ncbi:MAG: nucleotidyl transferase AbiEii/AbiGii toxin family protein [Verrucomicrobia bacterium]|nr:nucleotidyl transferase AbiEii/AbiGii toxin family protein [Verrucomicrobiota bacterium]MBU6446086.1 nucleotidyl transferase AbiEii/AbiGii toxin family protein [Verrucomicrobiota bacterium]MDE3047320.1 nucleotidyl transferase AbiEii/AbiGii toxin family protein [Verrucomicrobiota bacterium]